MKQSKDSLLKLVWRGGKKDILLGLPWLPLYSLSEISLAILMGALLQLVFITAAKVPVIDLVPGKFKNYLNFSQSITKSDLIFVVPILIVIAGFIKLISGFMSSYLTERAGHRVAHLLRAEMLQGFLSSPGNKLDQKNPDLVANQLMQDTSLLQGAISKGTISAIRDFLVLLGIIISMLLISWKTFVIGLSIIIPIALLLKRVTKKLNFYTRESQKKQIELSTRFLLTHHGALTVNALRSHAREYFDFEKLNKINYEFMKKSLFVRTFFSPGMEFFAAAFLAIIFAWRLNYTGDFQAGAYSSMLILLVFSFRYIKNIAGTITFFSEIKIVLQRIKTFLTAYNNSNTTYKKTLPLPSYAPEAIIAKNIGYTAENGRKILTACSLKIPKGIKVALVGESGAGKTTLLRILAGLILPSEGEIHIMPDFLLASQFPYVFRGTVKENIIYAEETKVENFATDKAKELILALSLAYSPSGANLILEKKLGFLGEGLSGGEKARVALARTLFATPKLILLDEPTANLDAKSAELFWQAIHAWQKKDSEHTLVAVSHALHEVQNFDLCYIFENGRIIKQGVPKEILAHV